MEAFEANKSKLSLNTSGISQRIVQNWLLRQEYSICGHLEVLKNRLRKNQAILNSHGIKFNGGFFCILNMEVKSDFEFCSREFFDTEEIIRR